jgi:inorganic pyrophosphatase
MLEPQVQVKLEVGVEIDVEPEVYVFIEISKNSHIKYEYDENLKSLICDRVLHTPFKYEFNYGFIPNTMSLDNDPLDVVVLMDDPLIPGSHIKCRFLGVLNTEDDDGLDPKIIMCPVKKVDPTYDNYESIKDIPNLTREKISYFFSHYKDLENKHVKVYSWGSKKEAINIYNSSKITKNKC